MFAYKCSSYKRPYLSMTDMWVPALLTVQDKDTPAICRGLQIVKTTKSRDMWTQNRNSNLQKNSAETRRKKIPTETINCQIPCNKCNMQFVHLLSSGANLYHAKYASGKGVYDTIVMYESM